MQSLRVYFEKQRQEGVNSRQLLEEKLEQAKADFHVLKNDFSRQELTVSLLERERGEFYKEFSVMRKQFEQVPKFQALIKGQEDITELVKKFIEKESNKLFRVV